MTRCHFAGMLTACLLLAGCGKVGPLEPRTGASAPAKAYGAETVSDSDVLTAPSVQSRPGRSDELMRRSERREEDPFDLPPGDPKSKNPVPPPPASGVSPASPETPTQDVKKK